MSKHQNIKPDDVIMPELYNELNTKRMYMNKCKLTPNVQHINIFINARLQTLHIQWLLLFWAQYAKNILACCKHSQCLHLLPLQYT